MVLSTRMSFAVCCRVHQPNGHNEAKEAPATVVVTAEAAPAEAHVFAHS